MKKLILSCFLSALCLTTVYAVDDSGTCGENLNWSYDSSTKTLSITGQGDMSNYKFLSYSTGYTTPWWNYHMQIENISIANGVTSIGVYAFADCEKVANIILPNSPFPFVISFIADTTPSFILDSQYFLDFSSFNINLF